MDLIWNWPNVARTYRAEYPSGRLLFWKAPFQTLGFCVFVAMAIVLAVAGIESRNHSEGSRLRPSWQETGRRIKRYWLAARAAEGHTH